jgi:hypothetical protein
VSEREPGSDPIGDFQRWLMKAGARSLGRDVADKVRSTLGGGDGGGRHSADVWETATTEPPGDEPPECQWCPICRAARRYRESGGTGAGLGSQLAGFGDTLAGFAQDAVNIFESAMRAQQRPGGGPPAGSPGSGAPEHGASDRGASDHGASDHGPVVGTGVTWAAAVHAEHENGEAADERRDREERGEPGDGPADGGGDEQVEGSAE